MARSPTASAKAGLRRKETESPRDAALRIIKIRGEMNTIELMRALKLTETAVRRHLQTLQRDGLVSLSIKAQAKGRPLNVYRLTEKATREYFPTGYQELAARTLDTIFDTAGHKGVFEFLVAANQHEIRTMLPELADKTLKERVERIVTHFKGNGYMTDFRELPDGRFFVYHQHCAIYALAEKYRQLCFLELKLIEALAGTKVVRRQYIFKGQPICGYLVSPCSGQYE